MLRITVFLIIALSWLLPIHHAAGQFNIQKIDSSKGLQVINSPKGLKAWFISEPQLNIVSMTFSFLGGAAYNPPEQRGLSLMLTSLLMEGTQKRSSSELKDYLIDHGIELSFGVTQDRFIVSLRTTCDNLDNAISIFREIVHTPRFDEDDFQRSIIAQKTSLEYQLAQPATQAALAHLQIIMANHPYAFLVDGTTVSLSNMTTGNLRTYLKKMMARDSLIIGICGHLDPKQIGDAIDKLFADLPQKSALAPLAIPIGNFQGQQQTLTSSNPEATVLFSQNGLSYTDPDFLKLYILNHIIGEGMMSRLWQTIREQNGLAYAVGSSTNNYDKMKLVTGNLGTETINTKQAIDSVIKIWQDVRDNGVLDTELANAKSYLIGKFPLMFSSTLQTSAVLHGYQVNGLDEHYFQNRSRIINDITLLQINDFAKKFIDPQHLMITVVEKPILQKSIAAAHEPDQTTQNTEANKDKLK